MKNLDYDRLVNFLGKNDFACIYDNQLHKDGIKKTNIFFHNQHRNIYLSSHPHTSEICIYISKEHEPGTQHRSTLAIYNNEIIETLVLQYLAYQGKPA